MNKLFRIRRSVEGITASLNKQVAQLGALAESERSRAASLADKAAKLQADSASASAHAAQADKVAKRIGALVA